jgi:hypothetical protein
LQQRVSPAPPLTALQLPLNFIASSHATSRVASSWGLALANLQGLPVKIASLQRQVQLLPPFAMQQVNLLSSIVAKEIFESVSL